MAVKGLIFGQCLSRKSSAKCVQIENLDEYIYSREEKAISVRDPEMDERRSPMLSRKRWPS